MPEQPSRDDELIRPSSRDMKVTIEGRGHYERDEKTVRRDA